MLGTPTSGRAHSRLGHHGNQPASRRLRASARPPVAGRGAGPPWGDASHPPGPARAAHPGVGGEHAGALVVPVSACGGRAGHGTTLSHTSRQGERARRAAVLSRKTRRAVTLS